MEKKNLSCGCFEKQPEGSQRNKTYKHKFNASSDFAALKI